MQCSAGKEGAIILATGGDQSDGAIGNFYEGYMATGATTNETDDAVQANIVAVGYKLTAVASQSASQPASQAAQLARSSKPSLSGWHPGPG